ncbi:MAG TPA: zinc-finger domain-containing protein [Kiloniellales bacterium]|nr:zinc-finger domain-containing protein [Kiloniellales bacterium]
MATKERYEEDSQEVETEIVACDGGSGPLGHPRVWLNMRGRGRVECPYCSRNYVLKKAGTVAGR